MRIGGNSSRRAAERSRGRRVGARRHLHRQQHDGRRRRDAGQRHLRATAAGKCNAPRGDPGGERPRRARRQSRLPAGVYILSLARQPARTPPRPATSTSRRAPVERRRRGHDDHRWAEGRPHPPGHGHLRGPRRHDPQRAWPRRPAACFMIGPGDVHDRARDVPMSNLATDGRRILHALSGRADRSPPRPSRTTPRAAETAPHCLAVGPGAMTISRLHLRREPGLRRRRHSLLAMTGAVSITELARSRATSPPSAAA